jgi:hypothetical protein
MKPKKMVKKIKIKKETIKGPTNLKIKEKEEELIENNKIKIQIEYKNEEETSKKNTVIGLFKENDEEKPISFQPIQAKGKMTEIEYTLPSIDDDIIKDNEKLYFFYMENFYKKVIKTNIFCLQSIFKKFN